MSIRKTAKCLTMMALLCAVSGCLPQAREPVNVTNDSGTLVAPWGASSATMAAPSRTMAASTKPGSKPSGNLIMTEDPKKQAAEKIRKKQIDEARIALGILDRMAQRCVQDGDEAACNTLKTNWKPLSDQLHKTLSMMAGDEMQMPTGMTGTQDTPSDIPARPAPRTVNPASPGMMPGSPDSPDAPDSSGSGAPAMEKIIPMTEPGSDG